MSLVISTRIDARDLAALAQWLQQSGVEVRSRSDLLRLALQGLLEAIEVDRPEDPADALRLLDSMGLGPDQTTNKGRLEAFKSLTISPPGSRRALTVEEAIKEATRRRATSVPNLSPPDMEESS